MQKRIFVHPNYEPPKLYNDIMKWARESHLRRFNFEGKKYKSLMRSMVKHYVPSDCHYVEKEINVPGVPCTKQYVFPLYAQLRRVLSDPELVNDAMWTYDPKTRNGERVYGESNTSDLFGAHCKQVMDSLAPDDPNRQLHAPLILAPFDDDTICSNTGRLSCQFVMTSV